MQRETLIELDYYIHQLLCSDDKLGFREKKELPGVFHMEIGLSFLNMCI